MSLDDALDEALAAWAGTVRLPDATAADIFQRIVMTPVPDLRPAPVPDPTPGLDPRWWRQFTAELAAGMIASTRPMAWAA